MPTIPNRSWEQRFGDIGSTKDVREITHLQSLRWTDEEWQRFHDRVDGIHERLAQRVPVG